jgi:Ca-activated chloride channel family protein
MLRRVLALLLILVLTACGSNAPSGGPTPLPADVKPINFAYASSAQYWMDGMISAFNNTSTRAADGKRLVVVGHPMGSGAIVEAMVKGDSPYELIAPADKIWVDVLADRRKQRGEAALTISNCATIARSPVVMITWKSMAEVLGWPDREFAWRDVGELALSPSAWQGYDHPEWGKLTFGHAHPILSHGGLAAILGEAYAAAPLTASEVQSEVAKSFVRVVERSVSRYGSDTSSLIKSMAEKGQRYLHIAIGYESDVIANHKGDDPLIAIYPKETFVAEYSACVIGANADAQKFVDYLLSDSSQNAAKAAGYRPAAANATLGAPFDAAHGVDPNAKFRAIQEPPVDVIRAVQDIWGQLKRPLNLTLVIDVSGSMGEGGKLEAARTGATAFINRLGDDDVVTIYSFSDGYTLLASQMRVGEKRQLLLDTIKGLRSGGSTALYRTVLEARTRFKVDSKSINAIVVLTDGKNTFDSPSLESLLFSIGNAKGSVTIYTIGYGGDVDKGILTQIADTGNGSFFSGDPATINQVYLEIASQFGGSRGLGR